MGILQLPIYLGLPALLILLERKYTFVAWIGTVILSYLAGMVLGNLEIWNPDSPFTTYTYQITALLAIALVLFSSDFGVWINMARTMMLSFGLCILAALISVTTVYYLIGSWLAQSNILAGMSLAVYTGGTPNLTAVGIALGVEPSLIAKTNIADTIVSVPYLFLALSLLPKLLSKLLSKSTTINYQTELPQNTFSELDTFHRVRNIGITLGLGIICLATGLGIAEIFPMAEKGALIVSMVTLTGLACSLIRPVRQLPGSYETGNYLLLVFCVAVGTQIRWDAITQDMGYLVLFFGLGAYLTIGLHLLLAYIFKIDADTFLITSAAGIFSPVFIAPIAKSLDNKEIIAPGMSVSVIGYAVGNFLGLILAGII